MTLDLMACSDNGKLEEQELTISSYYQLVFALVWTRVYRRALFLYDVTGPARIPIEAVDFTLRCYFCLPTILRTTV